MNDRCTQIELPRKKVSRCIAGGMAFASAVLATCGTLSGCNSTNTTTKEIKTTVTKKTNVPDSSLLMAQELTEQYYSKSIRALESVRTQLGEDAYLSEIAHLGSAESAKSQGEYVTGLLEDIKANHGEDTATAVMRACGYKCIDNFIIETAKNIYKNSKNMQEFIDQLNTKKIGGGHLVLNGNTITAVYDQCYCDIDGINRDKTKCYCQCSCGWFEKLFATTLEQPVAVELIDSIKNDGPNCTFEITFEDPA